MADRHTSGIHLQIALPTVIKFKCLLGLLQLVTYYFSAWQYEEITRHATGGYRQHVLYLLFEISIANHAYDILFKYQCALCQCKRRKIGLSCPLISGLYFSSELYG